MNKRRSKLMKKVYKRMEKEVGKSSVSLRSFRRHNTQLTNKRLERMANG